MRQGITVVLCALLAACGRSPSAAESTDGTRPVTAPQNTGEPSNGAPPPAATTFKTASGPIRLTACSLLQKTEIETAIGSPMGAARSDDRGSISTCIYIHESEDIPRTLRLSIEWDRPAATARESRSSGPMITDLDVTDLDEHVEGIGDDAIVLPGGVRVRKGHIVLTVTIKGERDAQKKAIAIAKALLTRIAE